MSYHRGKLKDNILNAFIKLKEEEGKDRYSLKRIKDTVEFITREKVYDPAVVKSLKSLIEEGCVEKAERGIYRITEEGEKIFENEIPDVLKENPYMRTEDRYETKGILVLHLKIERAYQQFRDILERCDLDFTEIMPDRTGNIKDEEELRQTIINLDRPEEDCIEFMVGFHKPSFVDDANRTLFDFQDPKLSKYFIFSYVGEIYLYMLLPIYKKIKADGHPDFELEDIKIISFVLWDFDEGVYYTNRSILNRSEQEKDLYPFVDLLNNRWSFRFDVKENMPDQVQERDDEKTIREDDDRS